MAKLWARIKRYFTKFLILEIPTTEPLLSPEGREAVVGLLGHAGFQYLLARLRYHKYLLEAAMRTSRFSSLEEVSHLQSGLFWCNWLESQVKRELQVQDSLRPAEESEEVAFKEAMSRIEFIE